MKQRNFKSVIWGIALLLVAAALILENLGVLTVLSDVAGGISLPILLLAMIFLCIGVINCRRHPQNIVWYLTWLFLLFENNIAYLCGRDDPNLINNWLVLFCALLVYIALHLIFGRSHHKWNWKWKPSSGGHAFVSGSNTVYIDCNDFQKKYVENNLGATDIYFTNAEQYTGGATLKVENNLGQTNINVPSAWSLSMDTENNLGHIEAPANTGTPGGPILNLQIENNLGHVAVRFV